MEVKDLKVGDKVNIDGCECIVKSVEKSKVAKQGKAKVRLVLDCKGKEKIVIKLENDDLVVLAEIFQPVENLTEAETKIRLEHLSRIVETSYIANVDIIYSKLFELRKDISSLTKKDYDKAQFLIHSIFSNWDFEQQRHAKNIIAQIQLVNMGFIPNPYFPPVIGSPVKGEH